MLKKDSCLRVILCCLTLSLFTFDLLGQLSNSDAFVSYDLNLSHRKIKLTDIIEEVEFIRLEETAQSLISQPEKLHLFNGKIIITDGIFKGDIFVFDENGVFESNISRKGNGPEEYRSLRDVWIEDGLIAIYEHQRSIKRYKFSGDFVSESKLILTPEHVIGNSGEYFFDMNLQSFGEGLKFNLVQLDKKLNVLNMHFPFKNSPNSGSFHRVSSFFTYGESVGYYRPFSDTVYHFVKDKFQPLIHLEFGDNWHWDNHDPLSENVIRELRLGVKVWSISPTVGSRYAYTKSMYGSTGKQRLGHLIDRNNSEVVLLDLERSGDKTPFDLKVCFWESESVLYAFLPSIEAAGLISEASSKNWSFRETSLEDITSSENPVLLRVRIKDFSSDN